MIKKKEKQKRNTPGNFDESGGKKNLVCYKDIHIPYIRINPKLYP